VNGDQNVVKALMKHGAAARRAEKTQNRRHRAGQERRFEGGEGNTPSNANARPEPSMLAARAGRFDNIVKPATENQSSKMEP
jgi:hypothetical protein